MRYANITKHLPILCENCGHITLRVNDKYYRNVLLCTCIVTTFFQTQCTKWNKLTLVELFINSDVTKVVKIRTSRMQISAFNFVRMRMQMPFYRPITHILHRD